MSIATHNTFSEDGLAALFDQIKANRDKGEANASSISGLTEGLSGLTEDVVSLAGETASALAGKQDNLTGTADQFVGFDKDGNVVAKELPPVDGNLLPEGTPWIERDYGELLPTCTIPIDAEQGAGFITSPIGMVDGETYTVTYNGQTYECVSLIMEGVISVGNVGVMMGGDDTGEPFILIQLPDDETTDGIYAGIMPLDGSEEVTVSLSGPIVNRHMLPKSLMPDVETYFVKATADGAMRHVKSTPEDDSYTVGQYAFAEGWITTASGEYSHAEGYGTTASGEYSHAEGYDTTASGSDSHAEGYGTTASGGDSHAEGIATTASGHSSHAEGRHATASGHSSHAEGYYTTASGHSSHAEGYYTTASGDYSHAEGNETIASGNYSHAEGNGTIASGGSSHAEGYQTGAIGDYSHVEGCSYIGTSIYMSLTGEASATTYTVNNYSYDIIPYRVIRYNDVYATIIDYDSSTRTVTVDRTLSSSALESASTMLYAHVAYGVGSHAEGCDTIASGDYSHAEGYNTIASGNYSHVEGAYNISDTASAHIVGNGKNTNSRSNAHTIDWYGNAWFAGDVYVGSTSGTNKDEGSVKLLKAGEGGTPIVTATSTDGIAYTATVDGVTALTVGLELMLVPNMNSAAINPKLNVNGLGDKYLRCPVTSNNATTSTAVNANWLYAGKPVKVRWNGTFWVTDIPRVDANTLYNAVPVEKGGTGAADAATARTNLDVYSKAEVDAAIAAAVAEAIAALNL